MKERGRKKKKKSGREGEKEGRKEKEKKSGQREQSFVDPIFSQILNTTPQHHGMPWVSLNGRSV